MRFGVYCANYGFLSEPAVLLDMAGRAEAAGWDGFFLYDHIVPVSGRVARSVDPWSVLGAIASRTERVTLGVLVTPVARRQPWELAHQAIAVDRMSRGRLVLGVGLGAQADHDAFNPGLSAPELGRRLDEGLRILADLLAGATIDHSGSWQLRRVGLRPGPWNGTIPIWVGGSYGRRAPLVRSLRHQGYFPIPPGTWSPLKPSSLAGIRRAVAEIRAHRGTLEGFEIASAGLSPSPPEGAESPVDTYAAAGVTWWLEVLEPERGSAEALIARVDAGPPRLLGNELSAS